MQNQALIDAMERFYQKSYPELSSTEFASNSLPSMQEPPPLPDSKLSVNTLIKFISVLGIIYCGYRLINDYKRMQEKGV
jgi:hypothetical protein